MSSSIWTRCAGPREFRRIRRRPWRVVESQRHVSTRRLVDTAEEQDLLETLLDRAKPPAPAEADAGLHYLLATPFRYPPLKHGSRFGTRDQRGIWYGSEQPRTVFAESAYYRLVFLEGTAADLAPLDVPVTLFRAAVQGRRGIDLLRPPFDAHESELASPTDCGAAQRLGRQARADGCDLLRARSARDPEPGVNVAVLDPAAFAEPRPIDSQSWALHVRSDRVEATRTDALARGERRFVHLRAAFLVDGALPWPAA
jgi:hypothetical protein